ncbi:acyl-CoA thioesterase [Streptomyces rectiverticillatus]|uniref:acyl-CoA thioesterase n=1 Tax=Streptomyces rectiverticillatus TaxID=173860 RepID=UPI0015C2C2F0|nr:thioesterase family protein [Streptomyces rectiverticillatus]QLE72109.1 acyl-CoA thioesterase [Streptomyces rectiverticillatus]
MARHLYSCPLRWSDMDAFGHVNNAVFIRYLEEARIDFMFRLAPGEGSTSFQGGSVVARHEIDYLRPLVHRHAPVTVETWVTRLGAASLTVAYEVKDEEHVYVRASTVVVPFDFEAGRPRRITAEERMFLEEFRDEEEAGGGRGDGSPKEAVAV